MSVRTAPFPVVVSLLASLCPVCAPSLAAEEGTRLANWATPPYWSAASPTPRDGDGRLGAQDAPSLDALPSQPLPFVAIDPCRLADTRDGTYPGPLGPPALSAGLPRDFPVTGYCGIPATAQAVSFNVTVTNTLGPGFILVYPAGGPAPVVSTVNYVAGQTIANAAIVPLGNGGQATFVAGVSGTDLVLDVNGYYAPQAVVSTVNGLSGAVTLSAGAGIGIAPSGNTLTISSSGAVPSGPAGGDLTGTYPNPAIAAGAVGTPQLANGAVTAEKVAAGQVVKGVNGFKDAVTIQGGGGVTVTNAANVVTIAAPAGSMVLGKPGDTTLVGQGYTEIGPSSVEYWRPTGASPLAPRYGHTAVWTGTRMLVWGGHGDLSNPAFGDGAAYDPATDSWSLLASTGAPAARGLHSAVWTGSVMIVWGGADASGRLATGGVYNPAGSGSWSSTRTTGAPSAREGHTAVWVGGYMVVWGGYNGGGLSTGGRYSPPPANSWLPTNVLVAPSARFGHTAVAAGGTMIVWGGSTGTFSLDDGSEYDPSADGWSAIGNAPAWLTERAYHTAVWTGSKMIVFGGVDSVGDEQPGGGGWTRSSNSWQPLSPAEAPAARAYHAVVWTGTRMLVWGGKVGTLTDTVHFASGGAYDPDSDGWVPLTSVGAPAGRLYHTAIWTGSGLAIWGGRVNGGLPTGTGGVWSQLSIYSKN